MKKIIFIILIIILIVSVGLLYLYFSQEDYINEEGNTIITRIEIPEGYEREIYETGSFQYYLQNYPLKEYGSKIHYYNGKTKRSYTPGILKMDVGERNLQQCADCIMRLRAEYFYHRKEYDKIHFNFTNGFRVDYTKWMEGFRIDVNGNNTEWVKNKEFSNLYKDFREYLDIIYAYAGTYSLSKEMINISKEEIQIGDVFIVPANLETGRIGHAVIIVDMAINTETNEKIFVLAQGSTPALEMHIISNKKNPWFALDKNGKIKLSGWKFEQDNIMRFMEE